MRPKILLAAGLVVAFMSGVMASGIYTTRTRAFNPPEVTSDAPERNATPSPIVANRTHFAQPRTVYVSNPSSVPAAVREVPKKRSLEREALIIGGSAGAGAAIGAVAGGGKGAGIGALTGGIAGLVYDLATRNK
jgi:hypothetical protein